MKPFLSKKTPFKSGTAEAQGSQESKVAAVEERDPFANLKRLEENRPGFHWRGRRDLNALVYGTDGSADKNKR